ncbi:transglutaminase-like domain-containing protein [Crocinitomicaceae bacterium]|jgi:regulator of sirC expression with transglutaminase-like and TPR domain|nr:transglutaminase-like domain-containing protein [Crocinitomicaceae bacterium]MDG1348020.1 transglutaminase-like domain-containing protein [Crocinitomicaceae bacterium]
MARMNHLQALVRLVEDPDEVIYTHVRDQLLNYGPEAIPFLEISWEEEDWGLLFQSRIETIIQDIQVRDISNGLRSWANSEEKDLLTGAIAIARYQYPYLDEQKVRKDLQKITQDVWLEISQKNTALEKVRIMNKIFFGTHKFRGNSKDFHAPANSCINTVLENRKGNPLSLSLIYSIIAQNIEMPIYGVNLPNHFILAYMDEHRIKHENGTAKSHGVLFYINPFSKGSLFDEDEIDEFITSLNLPTDREFYEPCSNSSVLRRMLTNLIAAFKEAGAADKVQELTELREILE